MACVHQFTSLGKNLKLRCPVTKPQSTGNGIRLCLWEQMWIKMKTCLRSGDSEQRIPSQGGTIAAQEAGEEPYEPIILNHLASRRGARMLGRNL